MSQTISPAVPTPSTPKVGFVSLGCPKALVDSEQILVFVIFKWDIDTHGIDNRFLLIHAYALAF